MFGLYEYELGKAADILVKDLFRLRPGEVIAITADTESDFRVVNTVARAAYAADAKPIIILTPAPLGVGKSADPMLPVEALTALLKEVDAWVEFNNKWLLYSTPWDIALRENKKLRYLCLVGMNADMMVHCICRVQYSILKEFLLKVADLNQEAEHILVRTPSGTKVSFENNKSIRIVAETGYADTPGPHFMAGQVGWAPKFDTIEGVIVFDCSLSPPIGLLKEPVTLIVHKGKIEDIKGGREASEFKRWLEGFNDPNMFLMSHDDCGFHPNAKPTGNILEDERIWGCIEWGIGSVIPALLPPEGRLAASHADGICLYSSIWLDNVQMLDKGRVVHPELIELAKKLGKA